MFAVPPSPDREPSRLAAATSASRQQTVQHPSSFHALRAGTARGPVLSLMRLWAIGLLALCACLAPLGAGAQTLQPGQPVDPAMLQWPRFFATNGFEFAVYQPKICAWPGNQIQGRFVLAVRPAGTTNETYGVVFFTARTDIDKVNRLVTLEDFHVHRLEFPTQPAMQEQVPRPWCRSVTKAAQTCIPLDHLEAVFALSGGYNPSQDRAGQERSPAHHLHHQPSLLILVDGSPIMKALVGNYERVINTRAMLLWNKGADDPGYYLYAANRWYAAPSLDGPVVRGRHPARRSPGRSGCGQGHQGGGPAAAQGSQRRACRAEHLRLDGARRAD